MKSIGAMTIGELAAHVAEALRQNGIQVVLAGGSCVSIYTDNRYLSYDLDFIEEGARGRKKIAEVMLALGFAARDRYFVHPDTLWFVEFPTGPLAIGGEPVRDIAHLTFDTGTLRLLSGTDCIKDRLAHYYHWNDRQCLEQAIQVVANTVVDLTEVERWSQREGKSAEFEKIRMLLVPSVAKTD